jgi:hypothetical protein
MTDMFSVAQHECGMSLEMSPICPKNVLSEDPKCHADMSLGDMLADVSEVVLN